VSAAAAPTKAQLVVVAAGAGPGITPDTMVAGLALGRRIALAGARAGLVPADEPEPGRLRLVLVPSNVIPHPQWLRALRDMPLEAETLWLDPALVAVVETDDPKPVLEAAARAASAAEVVAALSGQLKTVEAPADAKGRFTVNTAADLRAAESWLLRGLIKDSEGFMSRHLERRISLAVTRRLVWTALTPNGMTGVSLAVGLAGAPFFLSGVPEWQVAGALLFLLHSILDGCDGEIARLKFLESSGGAALDFWGDNVVHVAVFGCMALGWSIASGSPWPLFLGVVAVASTLVAAFAVAPHKVAGPTQSASRSAGARMVDALANRDFIYLIIALAAFGKAGWFLVFVAIGTPVFVLLRLWADRRLGRE
jgi:1L-myo-inositol 1-phosphate cytidylyltransferase / CDP-L-myo-inositol myo-inositolphosphotransferase